MEDSIAVRFRSLYLHLGRFGFADLAMPPHSETLCRKGSSCKTRLQRIDRLVDFVLRMSLRYLYAHRLAQTL